jgi:UDP-N-acetylmuramoylalanine-D-glutamate ligase
VARVVFNDPAALHFRGSTVFDAGMAIGDIGDCNPYLARAHNLSNLCAALTVAKFLGFDLGEALAASADFRGLPHRQQELGEIGGVLWVDDSISTAPEAALAALAVYSGRRVTLIAGGYDRGVDYAKLTDALGRGAAAAVICLGPAGARLCASLRALGSGPEAVLVASMAAAVARAREVTPAGGVVLLSPAAPSYGLYRDFSERGRDFAAEAGFTAPVEARQR